jgi:hypothetical protein
MKIAKLIGCALCATVLAALVLVGCQEFELYEVNAPAYLQHRIDSIADAKPDPGDTTFIIITTGIVGAEDNSAAWWTAFSDYFTIPTNKLLHLEFVNHSSGGGNWNNWNLAVANEFADRASPDYKEYFVLRSDAWGWSGTMVTVDPKYAFSIGMVTQDYPDTNGNEDIWDDFRTTVQGAYVTIDIDHSATGNVYVTAKAVGTNGITLTETYQQPVSATADLVAFLIADGSHFEMKKAYLLPSKVTVVEDVNPVSIAITGAPAFVELGNENFWGDAIATVTFADGSSEVVDSVDIAFNVVPDMTTLGTKTVVAAYSKTKQGNFGPPVSTLYNLEVTNSVVSLEVTSLPDLTTYYFFNPDPIIFNTTGIVVTATYSDGSTSVMPNASLQFGTIPAVAGAQNAVISYVGATSTVTTNCPVTLVQGTSQVGATNLTTGFWGAHSADFTVASGASKVFRLYTYSTNAFNWNSPITILRAAAGLPEYAVVRMDNFGWGDGFGTATGTHDWDFGTMASNISGSYIEITVTNNGNNTANIRYDVTHANGETHFQNYAGVTVDSSNLTCALTVDGCYLVLVN